MYRKCLVISIEYPLYLLNTKFQSVVDQLIGIGYRHWLISWIFIYCLSLFNLVVTFLLFMYVYLLIFIILFKYIIIAMPTIIFCAFSLFLFQLYKLFIWIFSLSKSLSNFISYTVYSVVVVVSILSYKIMKIFEYLLSQNAIIHHIILSLVYQLAFYQNFLSLYWFSWGRPILLHELTFLSFRYLNNKCGCSDYNYWL